MEFWTTIVALVRRKRVIIPALLIAIGAGATAYLITPVSYVSSTTMVLATTQFGGSESRDPKKPTDLTNPMLNFNESLTTTSAILIEAMNTQAVDRQVGATGGTQLIVDDGRTNPNLLGLNGPFLYMVGRSTSSPAEARRVVLKAQEVAEAKLRTWQSALNAPEKTYVSLAEVVPPSAPVPDRARGVKYAVLAFLLAFLTFMGIAYLRDRRRARRSARAPDQAAVASVPVPDGGPDPQQVSAAATPTLLDGLLDEQADLNGTSKPAVAPVDLNGTSKPEVEPMGLNGTSQPAAGPPDVNGQPKPAVEPTDLNGQSTPPVVATSRTRRTRPVVVHVPVKLKARSRNP